MNTPLFESKLPNMVNPELDILVDHVKEFFKTAAFV